MVEIPEDVRLAARRAVVAYALGMRGVTATSVAMVGCDGLDSSREAEVAVMAILAERQRCVDAALQEMARFDDVATGTAFRVANAILNP